jgi:hypothetical protein
LGVWQRMDIRLHVGREHLAEDGMFPIAHVWLLERLVPHPVPAHYIGCVWPDMLFGSPLTHAESHTRGMDLLTFARQRVADGAPGASDFLAFVVGVITHGSSPHGFDWYSDEQWGDDPTRRGYAFQHGEPIAAATAAACDVAPSLGPWKAHNIVEMSFELLLYAADASMADRFATACADADLCARLAATLAAFYERPAPTLAESIRTFAQWWVRPTSAAVLAAVYARQVRVKHGAQAPDEAAIAALIGRAGELVAADRDDYLKMCVRQIGGLLSAVAVR